MNPYSSYFNRKQPVLTRRSFLGDIGMGFSSIALASLLQRDGYASEAWAPPTGQPHFAPKAKSVIWLFMRGGVSHMESFDPKPELTKYAGKSIGETPYKEVQSPEKLKKVRVVVVNDANGQQRNVIYPLQTGFRKAGQSGIEVSDFFPYIRERVDDIAVIRSMWTTDDNHGAQVQFHSGRHMLDGRYPTIGAWVNYGLGSLNDNLPQFINMGPRFFDSRDGHYLGPAFDAVPLKIDPKAPLDFAKPESDITDAEQAAEFALLGKLNRFSAVKYPQDPNLLARIKAYELAFHMQAAVPEHPLAQALNLAFMTDDGNLRLKGKIYKIYERPDNAGVAAVLAAHPSRFLGWIFLNPRAAIGVEELERWRHVPGFVGVKLHPHWHGWRVEEALPIALRCEELGLPILIHLGFAKKGEWRILADACPRLTLIFAHAGMPHFDRMWGAVREYPNLYLDVSSPYLDEALARDAVKAVGAERTLFGTDAPYGFHDAEDRTYDYGAIRGWVERLPLAAREIDRVLGGNVERLLGEAEGRRR